MRPLRVYAGLDLGGTNFRLGLREAGKTQPALLDSVTVPANGEWTVEDLAAQYLAMLQQLRERQSPRSVEVVGLGFALTGDIDFRGGACYSMKRFPALEAVPVASILSERLGIPVRLLNDGLTAALAELRAGAGQGVSDFVMVTLGTGIGGGVVMDGRLLTGSRGRVGKVGHQIIDADGPVYCHCGLPGCWQTFAGKDGVAARTRAFAADDPTSGLAALIRDDHVDLQHLIVLADAGDAGAAAVLRETGRYVGIGLSSVIKIFAPDRVLLGGGIAEGNRILRETAEETVRAYAIKPYQAVPVLPAALGKDAGVLGATFLADPTLGVGSAD